MGWHLCGRCFWIKKKWLFFTKNLQRKLEFFTTGWPFSSGKTILFEFRWFYLPAKTVQNRLPKPSFFWWAGDLPRWKSRCKFHLFLVFFGVIFYNGNLWNLQRILMEFTTDLVSCPGKWSKNPVVKTSKNRTFLIFRPFFFLPVVKTPARLKILL